MASLGEVIPPHNYDKLTAVEQNRLRLHDLKTEYEAGLDPTKKRDLRLINGLGVTAAMVSELIQYHHVETPIDLDFFRQMVVLTRANMAQPVDKKEERYMMWQAERSLRRRSAQTELDQAA